MYCTRCGKENPDQSKFCRYCGGTLPRSAVPRNTDSRAPVRKKSRAVWVILDVLALLLIILLALFAVLRFWFTDREAAPERTRAPRESQSHASMPSKQPRPSPEPIFYSYYMDNCSWTQAFQTAQAAGGRLAVLESRESFDDLTQALDDAGLTDTSFRIGARRETGSQEYRWVDETGAPAGAVINDPESWANSLWLDGEPSFRADDAEETCVELHYDAGARRWGFRDVPDAPCDPASGSCGYIVVFDMPETASGQPKPADSGTQAANPPASDAEGASGAPGLPWAAPADYAGAYAAYLSELEANSADIEAYTYGDQTALCDVYGDEVPELFYIASAPDASGNRTFSDLHICTWEDGMLRTLYTGQIHVAAGGGRDYCVFGRSSDKAAAIYLFSPAESKTTRQVTVLRDWNNPEVAAEKSTRLEGGEAAGTDYTAYGVPTDEAGYESACRDALSGFDQTLLTNYREYGTPEAVTDLVAGTPYAGQSCESLISYLRSQLSGSTASAEAAAYTEDDLRDIVSAYGTIGLWCYEDFDGNGTKEAFALTVRPETGDPNSIDCVYFVDSQGFFSTMATDITAAYYEQEEYCLTCQGKGFFHVDYGAYGSGYSTMLFSVRDGSPYELDLSRQIQGFHSENGVFYTFENDFSQGFHQYPKCELLYDPAIQQFSKGSRIEE